MTRLLVTGSRDWPDIETIRRALADFVERASLDALPTLVHGGARMRPSREPGGPPLYSDDEPRGADAIAHAFWTSWGLPVEIHWADWDGRGKAAGPIRNRAMCKAGADYCLAFILNGSPGATNCVRFAEDHGIPVEVHTRTDPRVPTRARRPRTGSGVPR